MLYNYTVTPLKEDHFEERVADIVNLYNQKISIMPLFRMTLVPEGNPVWDKAGPMVTLFERYRDKLSENGVPAGILVQASLGHAYQIEPNPFQKYINLRDGQEEYICCPEDEAFIAHFCGVLKQLAAAKPAAIMLDDDFRMSVRPGLGCVCPLHLAKFNRLAGTSMTRDELRAHVLSAPADDRLADIYRQTQTDSLINAAKAFRAAIDEIDPTIQGINCTSGHFCDSVIHTNPIFAGKGNPTMVRVPNGIYAPITVRGFSDLMRQAAICGSKLRKHGIDIILAETDTIPFNRYGKGARHLHAHYTASILDGLRGAKHWLYRSTAFEPNSGKAYRAILAEHSGMYEKLAELSEGITWQGANSAFIEQEKFTYDKENFRRYHNNDWVILNLERMGLPFYFSEEHSKATFLEGDLVRDMTDEQIKAAFTASVFLDGESAKDLIDRGYGDLLGISIAEWDGRRVSDECFDPDGAVACTAQKNRKEITLRGAEALSYNFVWEGSNAKLLSPAVSVYRRDGGKLSVVYCGSPTARHHYTEGFSFLNETRKAQFIDLLKQAGALPCYYPGDEELCLRAGLLTNGDLLVALYNLGYDPIKKLSLYLEKKPETIGRMLADGTVEPLRFTALGNDLYEIDTGVEPMEPVILIIK